MHKFRIIITGIVQGVGFRPFVYNLAKKLGLNGWVGNQDSNVIIEIDAVEETAHAFIEQIKSQSPILSQIDDIKIEKYKPEGFTDFEIRNSSKSSSGKVYISPDVCICKDCISELGNPANRRYLYPFINCTNCGPRFTIIKGVPYDRQKTTMSEFEMCESCRNEYTEPSDRRYHAQPISCHQCGPSLFFADDRGRIIENVNCISSTIEIIKAGKIAAIKGIGGYHLACSALSNAAVDRLRAKKHRDDKPFAVMMRDAETVRKYCYVNDKELRLLESPASPIVLLEKKADNNLANSIAPLNRYLGVMLPYTPVHYLLFSDSDFPEALVMTSGNLSSEPIFFRDEEAVNGLVGIADAFLINNREIYIRTDDSVTRVFNNKEYIIRRSRGYVPLPVKLDIHRLLGLEPHTEIPSVLACGGELKNVFCLNRGDLFYMSHHIGDLENDETNSSFKQAIEHFIRIFETKPQIAAYDLHPGYFSSQYGAGLDMFKVAVQHHKAHIASCMAENGLTGQVIGVSFDGTGYGEDNNIWGGEFFVGGYRDFIRAGHLAYVKMPGGDAAVKHPWRMALSQLRTAGLQMELGWLAKQSDIDFITAMLDRNINCPLTSSMGRLFDAVSALLDIKTDISYEGQAAIELEYYSDITRTEVYSFEITENGDNFEIETAGIIAGIVNDLQIGKVREEIASKFHSTVAEMVVKGCCLIRKKYSLNRVVLSGGVFQNVTLLKMAYDGLKESGFEVFIHSEIPANDAGIAIGQAIIALARYFDTQS